MQESRSTVGGAFSKQVAWALEEKQPSKQRAKPAVSTASAAA